MRSHYLFASPLGPLTIEATSTHLVRLSFGESDPSTPPRLTPLIAEAMRQIEAYLQGDRHTFDLPLAPEGTPFQQKIWNSLRTIPYGETRTYRQVAEAIGNDRACRAVGRANNRNPLPILIPCHRVIGSDGSLVGYGGGMDRKQWLLQLEREHR